MKNKYIYFTIIFCFYLGNVLFAQMGVGNLGLNTAKVLESLGRATEKTSDGKKEDAKPGTMSTASDTKRILNGYNPALDNHLFAPVRPIGLFGHKMKHVERILVSQGAKRHSYAFGKYSRLSLSIYLVTVYFDKKRIVGGVSITPVPPYKVIAPHAREYFMKLFLNGNSPAPFKTQFLGNRLELRYAGS